MTAYFMLELLIASVIGLALWVLICCLRPITQIGFSQAWHYYAGLIPVIFLLGATMLFATLADAMPALLPKPVIGGDMLAQLNLRFYFEAIAPYLFWLWLIGFVAFLALKVPAYLKLRRAVSAKTGGNSIFKGVTYPVPIVISPNTITPMLIGVFMPTIVLPERQYGERELQVILSHELIHLIRRDLFVKWLLLFVNAVHWFNPFVRVMNRQITAFCENSCDEKLVSLMEKEERKFYGEIILSMLEYGTIKRAEFSTAMSAANQNMKRRLSNMMKYTKIKLAVSMLSIVMTAFILISGATLAYAAPRLQSLPEPTAPQNAAIHMLGKTTNDIIERVTANGQALSVDITNPTVLSLNDIITVVGSSSVANRDILVGVNDIAGRYYDFASTNRIDFTMLGIHESLRPKNTTLTLKIFLSKSNAPDRYNGATMYGPYYVKIVDESPVPQPPPIKTSYVQNAVSGIKIDGVKIEKNNISHEILEGIRNSLPVFNVKSNTMLVVSTDKSRVEIYLERLSDDPNKYYSQEVYSFSFYANPTYNTAEINISQLKLLDGVYVLLFYEFDANGNTPGGYSHPFIIDSSSSPPITSAFSDVPAGHWALADIMTLVEKGVISGYPDGSFKPGGLVSRSEFAKMMPLTLGMPLLSDPAPSFADVGKNDWEFIYVETAKKYLTGYQQGNNYYFKGKEAAVREDMAVALVNALKLSAEVVDENELCNIFSDWASISPNLRKHVLIAYKNGLISGYPDGTFGAQKSITRAETAALLIKVLESKAMEKVTFD